jgi:hypothetical protein
MGAATIFDFEQDFSKAFQCIPMAVRYKLDRSGVKLSLRQWKRFTDQDRREMLARPCETAAEVSQYRETMAALISSRAGEAPKFLEPQPGFAWDQRDAVPEQISGYARSLEIPPPTLAQWRALSVLQRFALLKLSYQNHDNLNFVPAMKEFKLLPAPG